MIAPAVAAAITSAMSSRPVAAAYTPVAMIMLSPGSGMPMASSPITPNTTL